MERARYYWRLYRRSFGPYTPQILLIITLAFVSSAAEGLGVSTLIPIIGLVGGAGQASDTISQIIAGLFSFLHFTFSFRILLVFIAMLFIVRVALMFCIQYATGVIVYNYERDMREKLFSATLGARWPYLSHQKIGNLEQLLTTNTTNASQFFGNISTSAIVVTKIIMYLILAINISWWIAALALLGGAIMAFALRPFFSRNRAVSKEAERTNRDLAHFISEHIIGMKAIKAMALEMPVLARGRTYFESMRDLNTRSILLRAYEQALIQASAVVFVGIIFTLMYRSPGFTFATFAVIVYAISQIFSQIQSAQTQLHTVGSMLPYIGEIQAYGDRTQASAEEQGGDGAFSLARELRFDNVSFSYPNRAPVFSDCSATIRQGELVVIVGPSGAGKTTFADLILRLIEPTNGIIEVDGRHVRDIPLSVWREHVGYMPQDAVLLNDTIAENIRFYDPSLTKADIERAAKQAHIHHFVETLPGRYGSVVGDRGVTLSGGQRQRIALARVLARKPTLLVLDEATSALDPESEQAIQAAIEELRGKVTVIVIAHRTSIIQHADKILSAGSGSIREVQKSDISPSSFA